MRSPQSASVWSRLEPLLGKVQKPARYIGCEDGAVAPVHSDSKVSWLLTYPEMYEVGLPNQGLQILYEILNERDDSVAERSYAPYRRRTGSSVELVGALFPQAGDIADTVRSVLRTEQWVERDGARRELLPVPAAVLAPTELVGA